MMAGTFMTESVAKIKKRNRFEVRCGSGIGTSEFKDSKLVEKQIVWDL